MSNPFQTTVTQRHARPGAPRRAWIIFLFRRGLIHLLLPLIFAALGFVNALSGPSLWWIGALSGLMLSLLWLPATAAMLHARFLGPREDDYGVLLVDGSVIDRSSLRVIRGVQLYESILAAPALLLLSANSLQGHWWLAILVGLLGCVPLALRWSRRVAFDALIDYAGGDYARSLQRYESLERAPQRVFRSFREAAQAGQARCLLRLGRPEEALALLRGVTQPARRKALMIDHAQAGLEVAQHPEAVRALLEAPVQNLAQQVATDRLRALLALSEHRPEEVLAQQARWGAEEPKLPLPTTQDRQLYLIAAEAQAGRPADAHARWMRLEEADKAASQQMSWIAAAHPFWHEALQVARDAGQRAPVS